MSEDNNFENEENDEEQTAPIEEATEAATEAETEATVVGETEMDYETAEGVEVQEPMYDADGNLILMPSEELKKSSKLPVIIGAVIAVLVIAAVLIVYSMGYFGIWFNKYNRVYIDTTGRTISDVAEQSGMSLDEFLDQYQLPKDMPKNTYESAAFYAMPASKAAEMYGMSFDQLKELLKLPEEVSEDQQWGEVEGEASLGAYIGGEQYVDQFKEEYGLGDEVTADTKWKDIRNTVDQKAKEQREEQEAQKDAPSGDEESSTNDSDTQDAPAEDDKTAE